MQKGALGLPFLSAAAVQCHQCGLIVFFGVDAGAFGPVPVHNAQAVPAFKDPQDFNHFQLF